MKSLKDSIVILIVLCLIILILGLANEYAEYKRNLASEIHDYKCEIVDIANVNGNDCDIIIKTNTGEYYTIESTFDFYNDIKNADNYHKCRIIERYHHDKLYDTLVILIF